MAAKKPAPKKASHELGKPPAPTRETHPHLFDPMNRVCRKCFLPISAGQSHSIHSDPGGAFSHAKGGCQEAKTKAAIRSPETKAALGAPSQIQPAVPERADPLPGNEDVTDLDNGGDLSFAAERRDMLRKHIAERKAITGNKPPEWVEVIYCESNDSYLYKQPGALQFSLWPEKKITRDLRRFGLSEKWRPPMKVKYPNGHERLETPWSELEWPTANACAQRRVYYAGSIPGHKMGEVFDESGKKLYVVEQSSIWSEPVEVTHEPELSLNFIGALLGNQTDHFLYMMTAWLEACFDGAWQPGPVLWLVSKADFGKSLLIDGVIGPLFGGRKSDPSKSLLPKDARFSGQLLGAEIWAMDDLHLSPHMDDRMRLAALMKTFFHARSFTFEDKGQRPFTVNCWRRGVNGLNDTEKDLKGMPPMRPGVTDKHCIYRCEDARETWQRFKVDKQPDLAIGDGIRREGKLNQAALIAALKSEAPLLRAFLRKNYQNVPARFRDDRYGVKAIQHLELMRELAELSPEAYFLSCIDEVIFDADGNGARYPEFIYKEPDHGDWRKDKVSYPYVLATSKDIESRLMRSDFARRVEHQLRSTHKILEQLVEFYPERVIGPDQTPMRNGSNRWRINNPFRMEEKTQCQPTTE